MTKTRRIVCLSIFFQLVCLPVPQIWGEDTIANWESKKSGSNRIAVTTSKLGKGTEIRIRIVSAPKSSSGIAIHKHFKVKYGVTLDAVLKEKSTTKNQVIKFTVPTTDYYAISVRPLVYGEVKSIEKKDGFHRITTKERGDTWVMDVKVVSPEF